MKLIGLIVTAAALIGNLFQAGNNAKTEIEAAHGREKDLQAKLDAAQRAMAEADHPDADAVQAQLTQARADTAAAEQKLADLQKDFDAANDAGKTLAAAINEATEVPVNVDTTSGFVPVSSAPGEAAGSAGGEGTSTAGVGEQQGNAPSDEQGKAPAGDGTGTGEGAGE